MEGLEQIISAIEGYDHNLQKNLENKDNEILYLNTQITNMQRRIYEAAKILLGENF